MYFSLPNEGVLVITGATGWVGRTAAEELHSLLPQPVFAERVRLFASRHGTISVAGFNYPVYSLQKLPELAATVSLTAVLHTAFLTRDRLAVVGKDTYVATNRWITQQVSQALIHAPSARAVVISSGAAAADSTQLEHDPYAALKREEELLLANLVPSLVLRIYALSGRFIRDPRRFAIGDFLLMALRDQPIRIHASMPVLRSYGHAGDITSLAWRWLLTIGSPSCPPCLAAVSLDLDLLSLAQRITQLYHLQPVQASIDTTLPPDSYIADASPFRAVLAQYGITPTSLDGQVLDTAAGLMEGLGTGLL